MICYDPRDPDQKSGVQSTWKPTENPALIAASQMTEVDWQEIARLADYCDEEVCVRCFIVTCRECGTVQGQCGCDRAKTTDYVTCDECRSKKEEKSDEKDLEAVTCQN